MAEPNLADYGLGGSPSRPQIDVEAAPVTAEERAAALERVVLASVETERVLRFRQAQFQQRLDEHGWKCDEHGRKL